MLEYSSGIGEPTGSTHPRISQNRCSDERGGVMATIQTLIPEIVALNLSWKIGDSEILRGFFSLSLSKINLGQHLYFAMTT
jgi:hypothetical protein